MKVISYETFDNKDDFEAWQMSEKRSILQIHPVAKNMDGNVVKETNSDGESDNIKLMPEFGIIVTHWVDKEETDVV